MVDFPDEVWINSRSATVYIDGSSAVSGRDREFAGGQHYIRSDLVPQWRPIETMPDRPGQVFLSTQNGCYNVGIVLDQWVFLWKTKEPVSRDNYSHWMPISKVP